ncbi:MAG: V-type ATPase 116kDa subunit family protein [Bacillota bacterium]|nr:V-type ATPase 116kDa subunit family protein [Bacillota bacterium]
MFLPMAKVELVGPKSLLPQTLSLLHRLGTLHFEPVVASEATEEAAETGQAVAAEEVRPITVDEECKQLRAALEDKVSVINGILESLPPLENPPSDEELERRVKELSARTSEELLAEVDRAIAEQGERTRELSAQKDRARLDLLTLRRYETILEKIQPLAARLEIPPDHQTTAFLIERTHPAALDAIRHELVNLDRVRIRVEHEELDENATAGIVVYPADLSQKIHEVLADNVSLIRLPAEFAGLSPQEALTAIRQRTEELPHTVKEVDSELAALARQSYVALKALAAAVRDRIEELQCNSLCGETEFTFVIRGWVPRKDLRRTEETIRTELEGRVLIEERPVDEEKLEEVPVVMENPKWAKPFELILSLFQPPVYGTVDPTPFIAIFFPVFFGIIVGDAGYGLVWLIIALLLRRKFKNNPGVMSFLGIFSAGAIATILFGILYGEAFGDLPHRFHLVREIHLFGLELPFERSMENMMPLLFVTVGLGAFCILVGLLLGAVNAFRGRHTRHAMEKIGMALVLVSAVLFALRMVVNIPGALGGIMLPVGLVLLVVGGGLMGPMEVFSMLGNVASFARLMALGMSGVVLAVTANTLATKMGNLAAGLAIAGLLHAIALLIHAFSPGIHAIRLNVIEFFKWFYETGGKRYKPFARGR